MRYVPVHYVFVSAIGLMCMGGAAMACPDPSLSSGSIPVSASDQVQSFEVMAGGQHTLESCGLAALGTGQFRSAPDFSLDVSGMQGHELDPVRREAPCDPRHADQYGRWAMAFQWTNAVGLNHRSRDLRSHGAGGAGSTSGSAPFPVANVPRLSQWRAAVIGAAPAPVPAPAPCTRPGLRRHRHLRRHPCRNRLRRATAPIRRSVARRSRLRQASSCSGRDTLSPRWAARRMSDPVPASSGGWHGHLHAAGQPFPERDGGL